MGMETVLIQSGVALALPAALHTWRIMILRGLVGWRLVYNIALHEPSKKDDASWLFLDLLPDETSGPLRQSAIRLTWHGHGGRIPPLLGGMGN